jgi:hypothetical protein
MVRPGRDMLSGRVEIDETYVGGDEEGVQGRKPRQKPLLQSQWKFTLPKGLVEYG